MKKYHLRITTPAGNIFDGDAVRLSVRGVMGDLAIMAGHIPFVTALEDGEIKIYLSDIELNTTVLEEIMLWMSELKGE